MEVCVDSLESAINAFNGGASRLELCSSLNEGGLTPSVGLYKSVRKFLQENAAADSRDDFAVNCMIRCRPGDFFYSESEIDTMVQDLNVFVELQADGLVFGALDAQGNVDQAVMKQVLELVPAASSGIKTTFHRAFDVCAEWRSNYEAIASLGVNKLLTSGQKRTAYEGRELIARLVELDLGVQVIAGAGVNSGNLEAILAETKCKEFHASCRGVRESSMSFRRVEVPMGAGDSQEEFLVRVTEERKVKEMVDIFNKFRGIK